MPIVSSLEDLLGNARTNLNLLISFGSRLFGREFLAKGRKKIVLQEQEDWLQIDPRSKARC